jgi:hypothetical protein
MNCRYTSSIAFSVKSIFSMSDFMFKIGHYTGFIFRIFDWQEYNCPCNSESSPAIEAFVTIFRSPKSSSDSRLARE